MWPYFEIAPPVRRGHKVAVAGDGGGAAAMNALIARCSEAGVRVRCDSRVNALVREEAGRIVGVRETTGTLHLCARRGMLLDRIGGQRTLLIGVLLIAAAALGRPLAVDYLTLLPR